MRIAIDRVPAFLVEPSAVEDARVTGYRLLIRRLAVPALLLTIYFLQCLWFARTQSFTFDEPLHITTGLHNWRYGRFDFVLEHPPLGHLLPTLPIVFGKWDITWADFNKKGILVTAITDPVGMAMRTRLVNVVLGVALGVLLWFAARRSFSEGAANLVLALFAFSPSLIAHFTLVTTDGVTTLTIFLTVMQLLRWRANPSRRQILLLGVVLGFLLLAKLSTPPVFFLALGLVLVLKPGGWEWCPGRWNWSAMLVAGVVAGFVLWGGYFFHVSRLTIGDGQVEMTFPNRASFSKDSVGRVVPFMRKALQYHMKLFVPAGEYLEGLADLVVHNQGGHRAFILGQASDAQTAWFQPVLALMKWPPIVIILFVSAVVLLLRRKVSANVDLLVCLLIPVNFLLFQMAISRISTGERHFLPIYPFALLLCGATWEYARSFAKGPKHIGKKHWNTLTLLLILACVLNAADALRYAPGYLSYCNVLIPNRISYKYLSDSNLDWGQGLLALRQYQEQHPDEKMWLSYFGSVDPSVYGIQASRLHEGERQSGTLVVSATNLAGQYVADPGYRWVTKYPLKTILDHSLFIYSVPPEVEKSEPQK